MRDPESEPTWLRRRARQWMNRRVRRRLDSQDAVQEVYLRAARTQPSFDTTAKRRAWLLRVLRNLLASEARRRSLVTFDSTVPDLRAPGPSPSRPLQVAEESRYARERLRVLSDRDRRVVELRVMEGLPFREVAARLGLGSEAHARVVFQRSIERVGRANE